MNQDWTKDAETHRSNDSELYRFLMKEIERIIWDSASLLIRGQTSSVARTILSYLAHEYGMVPTNKTYAIMRNEYEESDS